MRSNHIAVTCIKPQSWDGTGAEDIILSIFLMLDIRVILRMRRCCKEFHRISRAKQLWVTILQRDVLQDWVAHPFADCVRPLDDLSACETEALAVTLLCSQRRDLSPLPRIVRIDQERPVTWFRLVCGKWLLLATSDAHISLITLWKVADMLRHRHAAKPISQAFLSGPVENGVVDIQGGALVMALSLCSPTPTVNVLSIRLDAGRSTVFVQLAECSDFSHVREIRGFWVGCAVHSGLNIPCLLNWSSGKFFWLYSQPNMFGGCIDMCMQDNLVAVVLPDRTDLFQFVFGAGHHDTTPSLVQSLAMPRRPILSASICPHVASTHPAWILVTCSDDMLLVSLITREQATSPFTHTSLWSYCHPNKTDDTNYDMIPVQPTVEPSGHISWFNVPNYEDGWIYEDDPLFIELPPNSHRTTTFLYTNMHHLGVSFPPYVHEMLDSQLPALYCAGLKQYDLNRGLAIIGNGFGEFAICDLSVPRSDELLEACFKQVAFPGQLQETILSKTQIESCSALPFPLLGPLVQVYPTLDEQDPLYHQVLSFPRRPEGLELEAMEGQLWDNAWELAHVCHFYGKIKPMISNRSDDFFQIGGLLIGGDAQTKIYYVIHPKHTLQDCARYDFDLENSPHIDKYKIPLPGGVTWSIGERARKQWQSDILSGCIRGDQLAEKGRKAPYPFYASLL